MATSGPGCFRHATDPGPASQGHWPGPSVCLPGPDAAPGEGSTRSLSRGFVCAATMIISANSAGPRSAGGPDDSETAHWQATRHR